MRLFVAAWPPADVRAALAAVVGPEPPPDGVRLVPPDQFHVTLRFLGSIDRAEAVIEALAAADLASASAIGGPSVERVGQQAAVVPIDGLDELAAAVVAVTVELGQPPSERPFRGHITLARSKRGEFGGLIGRPVTVSWPVTSIRVVRSHLRPDGAEYETIHVIDLATPVLP